jgi:hypothetical protein
MIMTGQALRIISVIFVLAPITMAGEWITDRVVDERKSCHNTP